jgi:hypothetical protein
MLLAIGFGTWLVLDWLGKSLFEDAIVQTSAPLTLAQANRCPIDLPPEASNIQYKRWSCWVGLDEYVRFEAPPGICVAHAATVFAAWREGSNPGTTTHPLSPTLSPTSAATLSTSTKPGRISSTKRRSGPEPTCPSWFDPENISHGLASVNEVSHTPSIWIDLDRGVFYYHLSD